MNVQLPGMLAELSQKVLKNCVQPVIVLAATDVKNEDRTSAMAEPTIAANLTNISIPPSTFHEMMSGRSSADMLKATEIASNASAGHGRLNTA